MTEAAAAPRRSRRAVAAKIAGIVGVIVCVVIIIGVWLGRGTIASTLDGLAADVNSGFERAIAATDAVGGRLDDASASIDSIVTDATELAASASPSPQRLAGLQGRLGQLADRYRQLRERYAAVRENVTSVLSSVQHVARFVPGASIPQGPVDALAGVDAKLTAIDDALTSAVGSVKEGAPSKAAAGALSDGAARLQATVSGAATVVHNLTGQIEDAQASADNTIDGIHTLLLVGALALSILFVWVLLLNIALWLLGRAWERESKAVPAAAGPMGGDV